MSNQSESKEFGWKLQPNHFYRTRRWEKARVLCIDAPGVYPVVGYIERDWGNSVPLILLRVWNMEGKLSSVQNTPDDLVSPAGVPGAAE